MLRRSFVLGTGASLAGCASLSSTVAVVAEDCASISRAFSSALADLGARGLVSADTATQINMWLTQLQAAAASVKGDMTSGGVKSDVQQVVSLVNSIVGALAMFPLPPPIPMILEAAVVLLPVIEAAVDLVIGPTARVRGATPMSPVGARLLLRAYR